mgnify:FL=1
MVIHQPITNYAKSISTTYHQKASLSKRITIASLLGALAAILQSAGGFIPIVGLLISPFATLPIIFSTILSIRYGFLSYLLTIFLLLLIQPSELIIFPFTTGLLGLAIGYAFHFCKRRINLIITGSLSLLSGILIVLFLFRFPLLGPSLSTINLPLLILLIIFCFLYSWLWVKISGFLLKRLSFFFINSF